MDTESYHHWMILTPPLTGDGGDWLARGLADARATLLHRLELTSARLRLRGLRLHVAAATPPDVRIPAQGSLGLALTIVDVDDSLRVREALYGREAEGWRRLWLGYSLIGVSDGEHPQPMPDDLREQARGWLRLFRDQVAFHSSGDTP
ncbi:hypothetical protein [Arhodomonas sp. SL1]|uniref:hypothetical protein n=1 Tax=Arhodomonas sp. SL1 TaxID=3425691 RepID=UPI003F883702